MNYYAPPYNEESIYPYNEGIKSDKCEYHRPELHVPPSNAQKKSHIRSQSIQPLTSKTGIIQPRQTTPASFQAMNVMDISILPPTKMETCFEVLETPKDEGPLEDLPSASKVLFILN